MLTEPSASLRDEPPSEWTETQAVGRRACLELVFGEQHGRTILEHARVESPLKITRPYHPDSSGVAQLLLMSPAPGIFGGDDWTLRIRVNSGAAVQIAAQGALRVHPDSQNQVARLHLELQVADGADLHWEMEPTIPFQKSRLYQSVRIHLAPKARLFYWEAFCSGRVQHGESWQFKELRQDLQGWRGDELLVAERYALRPQGRSPNPGYAPQESRYFASALLQNPQVGAVLESGAGSADSQVRWALDTPVENCGVVRMQAEDGIHFQRGKNHLRHTLIPQTGGTVPHFRRG